MDYTLNCNGQLLDLSEPRVMGILNATPDSFFAASRSQTEAEIAERTQQILQEGATMIDVGACSTRPDSEPVSEQEEMQRLRFALPIIRKQAPDAVVSVDTFRPNVARMVVEEHGVDIINDVGAPVNSKQLSANNHIYMSRKSTMKEVMLDSAKVVDMLRSMGQKDIILDPGFGFGKTVEQNYRVFGELERMQALHLPVLVGISRKSMIWKLLGCSPAEALNSTTVLNTLALVKGASILRVHDVKEAMECVKITQQLEKVK